MWQPVVELVAGAAAAGRGGHAAVPVSLPVVPPPPAPRAHQERSEPRSPDILFTD